MTARACGDNGRGQLGMGTAREIRTLSLLEMNAEQETKTLMIASSNSFVASVDIKGQVWISGMFAEVVDKPDRYKMQILDMQIPTRIVYVAAGFMHCLALSEDMHVFAAGKNWSGQLGVHCQFVPRAVTHDGPRCRFVLRASRTLNLKCLNHVQ